MTTEWAVSTSTDRIALDATRSADVLFTVTNKASVDDRAVLDVIPSAGADKRWFDVEDPQRLITAGASVPYRVKVTAPSSAPAGTHFLQARVYSANSAPEESSRLSNRIGFDIPSSTSGPAPSKPWWLIIVAALVAVVLAVVGWLVLSPGSKSSQPDDPSASATTPDPTKTANPNVKMINLVGLQEKLAAGLLKWVDLKVGTVRYSHYPPQAGKVTEQSVPAGKEVPRGTPVNIVVAVALAKPELTSPRTGTAFAEGSPFPILTWQPVAYAAGYLVQVETEVCVVISTITSEIECKYRTGTVAGEPSVHTTSVMTVKTTMASPKIVLRPPSHVMYNGAAYRNGAVFHNGKVRWQVVAIDNFDVDGPPSGYITFRIAVF